MEIEVIEIESQEMVTTAENFAVTTPAQYEVAVSFLKAVKGLKKTVLETFDPIVKKAHATWKEAKAQSNKHNDPLDKAEKVVKGKMADYTTLREKIRREQEEKLQRQAQAEEKRKRKALEERAKKAEEKGNQEKAEELREKKEEVHVEAPILAPVAKTEGISYREDWKADVVDFKVLPDEWKLPDMVSLNKHAQNKKGLIPIPGVRFYSKKVVINR